MVIPRLDEQGGSERPWHWECHLRTVVGGLNHLRGMCTCTGGAEPPDPPWLNTRQAAIVAASVWEGMRRAPR